MRAAALLAFLALSTASAAHAELYAFYECNFRPGKNMADLDAWVAKYRGTLKRIEDGSEVVFLTPQFAANAPDLYWLEIYPDGAKLGIGLRDYFEKGVGAEADAAVAAIVDCTKSNSLWWGRTVYRQRE